ncbi:hypothetical protein CO038_00380 [Candidatus Pacearchaeota archaeon CG_4_9_14_0_2_um_filter_39_13]|nr:redox-regulated ATPase YchF [Candidatus Pacearchaeota archaeon]OIO42830.1 MAG: hypothetical protein AUJ64_03510 [Candidatus Pacearchaeota archaeon CG1_02_39_14]PJC45078.1 MAG: hypothetical protein CO038_00380 [Candidatus Pacearchaeota archaeon CG_4_9_14_0_2_um_filter_39_13]
MLIGLVGRPSAGKSTFFKAATLADAEIANYPFTTIKPNHAMAYVRIKDLAVDFGKHSNPREGYVKKDFRFVPFELMDVAGLVEGASEGKGLGNEFLNDLAGADAFIHVVDMSGELDSEGKPADEYDVSKDVKMIEKELDLWYLGILNKGWEKFARAAEMQKSKLSAAVAKQFSGLKVTEDDVKSVLLKTGLNPDKPTSWNPEEVKKFSIALRKMTKPMIIAANKIDRPRGKENFEKVKEEFDYPIVPCYAEGELALREADKAGLIEYIPGKDKFEIKGELSDNQKKALDNISNIMKDFSGTGIQEVLNSVVFDLLKYIAVYPAGAKLSDSKGNVLPDCYLMPPGSTALDFAFRLHSDIGKAFVKAVHVKTKQAVGKDYVLKMGDGLEILTR